MANNIKKSYCDRQSHSVWSTQIKYVRTSQGVDKIPSFLLNTTFRSFFNFEGTRKMICRILVLFYLACTFSCQTDIPEEVAQHYDELPENLDFNEHVKPILSDNCFLCHGPDKADQKAGLNLADPELAFNKLQSGNRALVAGNINRSAMVERILEQDKTRIMPPLDSHRSLTDYEKAVLVRWIEDGAEYKKHWAFVPPEKRELPEVNDQEWPKNLIDHFILDRLEQKGWNPEPEASKDLLLRRVSLDLTGLPPTTEELEDFRQDTSSDAYEKVVDRLLASSAYGEKMAIDWMDLSRFADTHGYTVDRYRPMWVWRDWVIKALNNNMPYDQFVTWQIAGDLLPDRTKEQRLATAFNRNHAQNMEGGIVNEEFRVEYVADRTNTFGLAFLGMTMECARCHDHKFDPISQKDYFSTFAYFNSVDEVGQISWDNSTPGPSMLLTDEKQDSLLAFFDQQIVKAEADVEQVKEEEATAFDEWMKKEKNEYIYDPQSGLQAYYPFDRLTDGAFVNAQDPSIKASVPDPVVVKGRKGQAYQTNGDDILRLGDGEVGVFGRKDPFSISVWINIPSDLSKGVVFHKGNGDILYNFRGYFLNIREGKAELLMAHTWPYNSIVKITRDSLPKEEWIHLAMTYDGSSQAHGLRLYLNGREMIMNTERDNLYKDILFLNGGRVGGKEPGLQVGADWRGKGFTHGKVDELRVYNRMLTPPEVAALTATYSEKENAPLLDKLNRSEFASLYFNQFSNAWKGAQDKLEKVREQKYSFIQNIPEIMVMEDMEPPRPTYVLDRGVYDSPTEMVSPNVPDKIFPFPDSLPQNRLGLARWLFLPGHPLTARVVVNRYWKNMFGRGIHKNVDDFGNQGGMPDNLALLDMLALKFIELDWDIKALHKLMVMSATYRQSSKTSKDKAAQDPENIFLARGPAERLSAEELRDGALAVSGLLADSIGGPSVKPYQPQGVWAVNSAVYNQGTGEDLYRRSLYTFWRRTNPPPSMNTFDAPSRSYCTVKRQETNTPLQSLILLNDPQYVEASRAIAQKAIYETEKTADQVRFMYQLITTTEPGDKILEILTGLYQDQQSLFESHPDRMTGWLNAGESLPDSGMNPATLAAGAVVANTILNSDAYVTKR